MQLFSPLHSIELVQDMALTVTAAMLAPVGVQHCKKDKICKKTKTCAREIVVRISLWTHERRV